MLTSGTLSMYENSENLDLDDEIRLLDIDVLESTQVRAWPSHRMPFHLLECSSGFRRIDRIGAKEYSC